MAAPLHNLKPGQITNLRIYATRHGLIIDDSRVLFLPILIYWYLWLLHLEIPRQLTSFYQGA